MQSGQLVTPFSRSRLSTWRLKFRWAVVPVRDVTTVIYHSCMGLFGSFKEKLAAGPVATFGDLVLYGSGEVGKAEGVKTVRHPVGGVTARVESGSALEKRVTATRLVAMGVFAFAAKKKRGGESWLTLESDQVFWSVEVKRGDEAKAREFAAKVNQAARS